MAVHTQNRRITRTTVAAGASLVLTGAMVVGAGATAHAAAGFNPDALTVAGSANGGYGNLTVTVAGHKKNLVNIPQLAPESLSSNCGRPIVDGKTSEATIGDVHFISGGNSVLVDKTVDDFGQEQLDSTSVGSTQESRIEDLSAVGGAITADVIDTTAHTSQGAGSVNNHLAPGDPAPSGVTVVNLSVFGHVFNGAVPANTKVSVNSGNYVVLNEQTLTSTGITVNAIDIHLAALGSFSGKAVVAHAQTLVKPASDVSSIYTGDAFAANLTARAPGVSVSSGDVAEAGIGCSGGTASRQISSVSLHLPGGGTLVGSTTAKATVAAGAGLSPNVTSSEDIQAVNLLGGLVTADALHVTSTTNNAAGLVTSQGGTTFVNLVVNGQPIAANPAPNTMIDLPGLGTVTLNKQICSVGTFDACMSAGREHLVVTAIDVKITVGNNSFGLPLSTALQVAHADSGVTAA